MWLVREFVPFGRMKAWGGYLVCPRAVRSYTVSLQLLVAGAECAQVTLHLLWLQHVSYRADPAGSG